MNQLNFSAIHETRKLLNESIFFAYHRDNYSDTLLNGILSQNLDLFWTTMHQCLDLTDIMHQYTMLNQSLSKISTIHQQHYSTVQFQSLYDWCNFGRSTWFTNVFTLIHDNSWQERISFHLQNYLVPILLIINCLSLITCISGVCRLCSLSNRSNRKVMIIMKQQSIVQSYLPATWPLVLWYCIFGLLWLMLVLGFKVITLQLFKTNIGLHSHDFYCRTLTYLTNILRYIPTWLICLMLCDRAIGEHQNRNHIYTEIFVNPQMMNRSNICIKNELDSTNNLGVSIRPVIQKLTTPNIVYSHTGETSLSLSSSSSSSISNCQCQLNASKEKQAYSKYLFDYILCKRFCSQSQHELHCVFYGLKRTSCELCINEQINNRIKKHIHTNGSYNDGYEKLLKDLCNWNECGLGRVGGLVLFSIVTALICLINTHLLWLYKIGKSSKRCVLSAGDAVILSVFYPYLLKTCHSILPHILIFISLMLLGLTALKKSRLTSNSNSDCSTRQGRRTTGCLSTRFIESTGNTKEQNVFTEPTQLAIYLGIVNFLFEIAEVIEWLHMKFIIPNYFQPFTINFNLNPYINNNTNVNITNTDSILLSNSLYSSKLLSKSINQMCTIQFTSGLLRIWSSQRYLFTFPILFYKSSKFKHITKYFFKYYFQALKMQYLFKISFTAQNSTFIDSLNTSMHINASNNENTNNQISERINITEYINTHSHQGNTRIKTKRIPRVYCCSCSTHPLTLDGTIDNGKHSDAHEYH